MKRFNRKKLIPSLAASVIVAAATLAPLPGFLASGNVYATPPTHHLPTTHQPVILAFARPHSPATLNTAGTVTIPVTYRCTRLSRATTINVKLVQHSHTATHIGSGTSTTPLTCDNHIHLANVIVTPNTGSFVVGKASATAKLENASRHAVSIPFTRVISIQPAK